MKEIPTLFCGAMVRGLLRGVKLQTRRVVRFHKLHEDHGNPQPDLAWIDTSYAIPCLKVPFGEGGNVTTHRHYPRWEPLDRLWVKETFFDFSKYRSALVFDGLKGHIAYRADDTFIGCHGWQPSIFMKRVDSRITLEVETVRVERVQDISERDAQAEGSEMFGDIDVAKGRTYKAVYQDLWNSINLKPSAVCVRVDEKRQIVGYESFPWSAEDFEAKYPGVRAAKVYRGKPITVYANPWVWVIGWEKAESEKAETLKC